MSLAVMPIRRVPWAAAGPAGQSGSAKARSRVAMRLMTILLGDEVTAGGVTGSHGMERRRGGRAVPARDRAPGRERAARRQRDQVRRRARDRAGRTALLGPAPAGRQEPG